MAGALDWREFEGREEDEVEGSDLFEMADISELFLLYLFLPEGLFTRLEGREETFRAWSGDEVCFDCSNEAAL